MDEIRKNEIEEQAIIAFGAAAANEYISSYVSPSEVKNNAYEILEFMPDEDVDLLTEEEFEYATEILLSQLY